MDGGPAAAACAVDHGSLFRLMPMAAVLEADGRFAAIGPTLAKVLGGAGPGGGFLEAFEVTQPAGLAGTESLAPLTSGRLWLRLRGRAEAVFRARIVPLATGGYLANLGFGAALAEALRRHALTVGDFAVTDHALDLIFLSEAREALTGELLAMTARMRGRRDVAETLALTDPLTGLANRRAFMAALDRAVQAAGRGQPFALLLVDLDRFKAVNDSFGHAAGDAVIAAAAAALRAETRGADLTARLGGDEFAAILRNVAQAEEAARVARRIIRAIERPVDWRGERLCVSASIGIARAPDALHGRPDQLLAAADAALYAAKNAGRGRPAEAP
ncbi:MAG: GGDEF domain-containing protein [Rhodobacteraceae bacterium]|nr:GGDEF domain-containing protein [Paracoccaceae bacterium]